MHVAIHQFVDLFSFFFWNFGAMRSGGISGYHHGRTVCTTASGARHPELQLQDRIGSSHAFSILYTPCVTITDESQKSQVVSKMSPPMTDQIHRSGSLPTDRIISHY